MGEHEWAKHQRDGWTYCLRCGMVRNHQGKETACRGELPTVEPRSGPRRPHLDRFEVAERGITWDAEDGGTVDAAEVAAELRRLRAACEGMLEQLERAATTPGGLGATLPSEPLEAAAKQIPSLRGWCRREAAMLRAALKGEL